MKVTSILRGSTIKAAKPSAPWGYLPELILTIADHYKFVEHPTDISQLIPHGDAQAPAPAIFRHGKVEIDGRSLIIDELQVFQNGTIVATPGDTTDSDAITDDIFRWADATLKIQFEPLKPLGHFSNLEVRFEEALPDLFSPLREVARAINQSLDPFWEPMPPYELISLNFGMDPAKAPKTDSGFFKIERRAGMPFEQGLHFCEAALTTMNHTKILEIFERICLENFAKV